VSALGLHDGRLPAILAIDTATSRVVVALGRPDGAPIGETTWLAGHRHGETLLPTLGRVLSENNVRRSRLRAIVVGTGPGTFTGLRVGLATAKGLAHGLAIPIVGVATSAALLDAAALALGAAATDELALLMPAGPQDRVLVTAQGPLRLPAGTDPELPAGTTLVAVDLAGRAPEEASALGDRALAGLGAALLRLGAQRLGAGDLDDLAGLVPEYVTLPRGIERETGEVTWSHDPR
jgi:tRNA threonylcarbamoyl adenosine modification protein YeaZ